MFPCAVAINGETSDSRAKRVENLPPVSSNLGQNKPAQCDRKDLTAYFQTTPGWCNWQHTRL